MEIARHWRLKGPRYRLEGSVCPICGQLSFPPRPACPDCRAQPAPSAGYALAAWPTRSGVAELAAHTTHQLAERVTG